MLHWRSVVVRTVDATEYPLERETDTEMVDAVSEGVGADRVPSHDETQSELELSASNFSNVRNYEATDIHLPLKRRVLLWDENV